ncbi:phosphoribosyltransferase [Roseiconus nitratireducens]|uniref:Phosphoribosyltransferase n=1 Tax=Roseiconus nitratireducens TaxID=2605748 RepID=A0A5M6DAT6_9BACT|nr:phosphoribosyltransferase family protein [Roseiconus nitratireducens]KAA5543129.1 phosphoribosyltransferase [Roseiconus nitratireducens]
MFHDRQDAGRRLAEELHNVPMVRPVVLGVPRGGMVVAAEIASRLHADLDIVLAHKLRCPWQPELAIGAINEEGRVYWNELRDRIAGIDDQMLQDEVATQQRELQRRRNLFRSVRPAVPLAGRTVILTDDGIATGATLLAAVQVVQTQNPSQLIVAVPVAAPQRAREVARECDQTICLEMPSDFSAVGQVYRSFDPVEDEEVVALLRKFAPAS